MGSPRRAPRVAVNLKTEYVESPIGAYIVASVHDVQSGEYGRILYAPGAIRDDPQLIDQFLRLARGIFNHMLESMGVEPEDIEAIATTDNVAEFLEQMRGKTQ